MTTDAASHLTRVMTDDETLLRSMEVDQSLRSIALTRTDDELVSHVSADVVFWALTDAHYPAVAVDADGRPRALERAKLAAPASPETAPADTYADLIERLRTGGEDSDAAWLERELDQACALARSSTSRCACPTVRRASSGSKRRVSAEADCAVAIAAPTSSAPCPCRTSTGSHPSSDGRARPALPDP